VKKISVLIVEDHKLMRETCTSLLNSDARFKVVSACGDSMEAISVAKLKRPNIILMDINVPPLNGFQATSRLFEAVPHSKVIALSFHAEMVYVQKMFASGAKGYMTKNSGCAELMKAIVRVNAGGQYICAEMRDKGFDTAPSSQIKKTPVCLLTNKEVQISHFIQNGLRVKEIAGQLNISPRTVDAHRYNIFRKLKVNNVASMILLLNSAKNQIKYALEKKLG
jgi:DNA-binding NarL/FixJ family response regulator